MEPPKQPLKLTPRKRMAIAAAAGVVVALACRALPEPFQLPCAMVAKLISVLWGVK